MLANAIRKNVASQVVCLLPFARNYSSSSSSLCSSPTSLLRPFSLFTPLSLSGRESFRCIDTKKNLSTLTDFMEMKLNNLRDNYGASKKKIIVGRGPARKGKTSGRGHKGHRARSGGGVQPGFQGGQTPLSRSLRKYGFSNVRFKRNYIPLNLGTLQSLIDIGRIDPSKKITMKTLFKAKFFKSKIFRKSGVKLLSIGRDWFSSKVDIEVSQVSKLAKEAILRNGGKVTTVYFNKLGLRTFLLKEPSQISIKFATAPRKLKNHFDVPQFKLPETLSI